MNAERAWRTLLTLAAQREGVKANITIYRKDGTGNAEREFGNNA